jgi:nicotinamide-nucleotide amidase
MVEIYSDLLSNLELSAQDLCGSLSDFLTYRRWKLVTAESCTGGLLAGACTDLGGSSNWFDRGFVTYSDEAKAEMLGVDPGLIATHGAVSEEVVRAMVQGALERSVSQVAVAVTGIAGPGGGSSVKPVGTVWFAWATPMGITSQLQYIGGDRPTVRSSTVRYALKKMTTVLQTSRL